MNTCGRVELQFHTFLTSALDRSEWSASCPSSFTLGGKNPYCTLNSRLGGPQSWSEHGGKEKKIPSLPLLGIKHWSSSP